ncbi:hypothetical protein GGS23DRAFT_554558 [Durotheca rogersii]|uniref:uncharacterized protein n=1 Tax=Durotheca rogersii TaxID=419775 RepID=UPI00221E4015|nr:uncharacterized protein GGS23DRAFT_554558 [Durotheca rogersii]KAI5865910.1 hypothetical protein GGS23DRAFT_554558 [Durotheca rogersii]
MSFHRLALAPTLPTLASSSLLFLSSHLPKQSFALTSCRRGSTADPDAKESRSLFSARVRGSLGARGGQDGATSRGRTPPSGLAFFSRRSLCAAPFFFVCLFVFFLPAHAARRFENAAALLTGVGG